jgi:hypothetical protein
LRRQPARHLGVVQTAMRQRLDTLEKTLARLRERAGCVMLGLQSN